jgi:hypothetical protein
MKQVTVVQYWWGCFTKVTFPYEMWYICIFFFKLLITIPSFLSLIPSLLHAFNLTSKFNYSTIHSLYHCFSLQPFHHSFLHYSFLPSPLRLTYVLVTEQTSKNSWCSHGSCTSFLHGFLSIIPSLFHSSIHSFFLWVDIFIEYFIKSLMLQSMCWIITPYISGWP